MVDSLAFRENVKDLGYGLYNLGKTVVYKIPKAVASVDYLDIVRHRIPENLKRKITSCAKYGRIYLDWSGIVGRDGIMDEGVKSKRDVFRFSTLFGFIEGVVWSNLAIYLFGNLGVLVLPAVALGRGCHSLYEFTKKQNKPDDS